MFVGEAPGRDEDAQGIPFVGRAGQLLTKIIESIGLTRDQVYIANVIKCRPPENRIPAPDEVRTCEPFVFGQVDAIKPKVIRGARHIRRTHALENGGADFPDAWPSVRVSWREAHPDVPSGIPPAEPRTQARRVGKI